LTTIRVLGIWQFWKEQRSAEYRIGFSHPRNYQGGSYAHSAAADTPLTIGSARLHWARGTKAVRRIGETWGAFTSSSIHKITSTGQFSVIDRISLFAGHEKYYLVVARGWKKGTVGKGDADICPARWPQGYLQ